jgi:hypothetical protein
MISIKYQSRITHVSIDKDLALISMLLDDKTATVDDFNRIGARFLIGDNVDVLYNYILPHLSGNMKLYFESMDLPTDHNNQRDRNSWAQMLGVYFMYIRTGEDPSVLVFSPTILSSILRVNLYYIIEHTYFDDVTDIIIHRTKANLELC